MTKIVNELSKAVEKALMAHEAFDEDLKINVSEKGGVITLTGTVPSTDHVETAEKIAKQQDGVFSVVNDLRVSDDSDIDETEQSIFLNQMNDQ